MSIQAFKGVEVGAGFEAARRPGSKVHDEIGYADGAFFRKTNRAGGLEGGMTNGETIVVRGAMKPIPTLYNPLETVDIRSKAPFKATVERSDVCAVPAAAVVAEAVVAARVSKSGNVVPQRGDLEGVSKPVRPGTAGMSVEIANEIR